MHFSSLSYKNLVLIFVLLLAGTFWRGELQAQSASLRLNWTDTSDSEDGFRIERLVGGIVDKTLTVPANATSYTDSALIAGTVYCYRVEAFNSAGASDPTNQACASAENPIAAVTASSTSTATAPAGTASLRLNWTDTSDSEDGFKIERLVGGIVNKTLTVTANVTSYVDSALVAGTVYCYRVEAFNAAGASDPTNQVCSVAQDTAVGTMPPTLTLDRTKATAGATITATWSGIGAPTPKDWLGLYASGSADTKYISWIYVSCSMSAASARASGSCSYVLPATLAAGNYDLRLFSNDGFTRLATSAAFTITTGANSTAPILLTNTSSSGTIGPNSVVIPQVPAKWTDYDLKLKLQSLNNNSIGVMFRYQDNNNYYRFLWNRKSKFRRLEKVQDGVVTVLAKDDVAYSSSQTYQLGVVVQGTSLRILIDGSQIFSVTDSTFAEGTIGLYSASNPGSSFDDVIVKDLATGVTLLSNNFADTKFTGWTIVDQSTNLGSSAWSAANGTLVQSSNIASTFALYTLRNWTDYRLTLKIRSLDRDSIGVMFRYQDNNNYYRFSWNRRHSFRRLEKYQNGILTVLAEDTIPYASGQTYPLEILAKGKTLQVAVGGNSIFSVTDSSFTAGTVALYSHSNQGSLFDDVLVEDLTTGTVLLQNDFNDGIFTGWTVVDDRSANFNGGILTVSTQTTTMQQSSAWTVQKGILIQNSDLGTHAIY